MNAVSPWQVAAAADLADESLSVLYQNAIAEHNFKITLSPCGLYVSCEWKGGNIAFRPIYSPAHDLSLKRKTVTENGITLSLSSSMGDLKVNIEIIGVEYPILKYTTTLSPKADTHIPFFPRDIIFPENKNQRKPDGTVHVSQVGTRSGILHFSLGKESQGTVFYYQNLGSLAKYNQDTHTSAAETVGGLWPELGLALPPTKDFPLKKVQQYIISDAIIAFDEKSPKDEKSLTEQYLDMLAAIYIQIPPLPTKYIHWPDILQNGLQDLTEAPGCWCQVDGKHFFNAYVSDYDTPPEIMVQLAVLLPLVDYSLWDGKKMPVMEKIRDGLTEFYDEKLKTIVRWLPAAQDKLKGEEEQKKPNIMDSWYLHHPLLNLSRLAILGDKKAEKLFLDSLPYAERVAKHFSYNWPVFYKMDTLETVKAETKEGEGGQHDVAGLYAHVMLQAYELTKNKKYLTEAERSARTLKGKGFKLFYQANNTAFSAGALLRLYKLTGKEIYLELSNLCLANIFQNVQLWECNYGYGRNYPTFFALFPLSDAPYTAVYEEQEVFCALHDYLEHAKDVSILPSIKTLTNEYIRHLVDRAPYYYPTMLPDEMLSEQVKVGEVDKKLWIALEDIHDGWEQSGEVGQEVYGAGNAFGILPRHYHKLQNGCMLYCDYPIVTKRSSTQRSLDFTIAGDSRINCRLRLIPMDGKKLPSFSLSAKEQKLEPEKTKEGHLEYMLQGDQRLSIKW